MSTVSRPMTGTVVGYDPGGNCTHGLAQATVRDGNIVNVTTKTLCNVEDVVVSIRGIDTLTCWGTGHSGWRPADRWLRKQYPEVQKSVQAPNSLRGAMSVSGMALLVAVRQAFADVFVTETHPKVLYHTFNQHYEYKDPNISVMNKCLSRLLAVDVEPQNEHEWDSAISILAVVHGLRGSWQRDLHALPTGSGERLLKPCGRTAYVWPDP